MSAAGTACAPCVVMRRELTAWGDVAARAMRAAIILIGLLFFHVGLGLSWFELGWSFSRVAPVWLSDALGTVLVWRLFHMYRHRRAESVAPIGRAIVRSRHRRAVLT